MSMAAITAFAQKSPLPRAKRQSKAKLQPKAKPLLKTTNPLTPLGINAGFLLAQIVNFLLIFVLLSSFPARPLSNMLDFTRNQDSKRFGRRRKGFNDVRNAEAEARENPRGGSCRCCPCGRRSPRSWRRSCQDRRSRCSQRSRNDPQRSSHPFNDNATVNWRTSVHRLHRFRWRWRSV